MIDELTREVCPVLSGSGIWPLKKYSFAWLLELNSFVCQKLNETDEHISDDWDLCLVELAEIVIAERRRAEKIDYYNKRPAK